MKKMIRKIINLFRPLYTVVYTTKDGRTEMYTIDKPLHSNEFGNVRECLRTAGFKAYCHNRKGIRSFRYDRITSLVKSIFETPLASQYDFIFVLSCAIVCPP